MFQSAGSREPDPNVVITFSSLFMFQSAGSREPDLRILINRSHFISFNPQARESLIAEASANPSAIDCFNPQARESLIRIFVSCVQEPSKFQSAGSREPDLAVVQTVQVALLVSIRRLARA